MKGLMNAWTVSNACPQKIIYISNSTFSDNK